MNTFSQCIRLQRQPYESEINEEMEEQYSRMQEEKDSDDDDDDLQEVDYKLQELEEKMEASNERLEERIDASSTRLESKINESHQQLEAMLRQLIGSHTSSTPQPPMDLRVPATSVLLQVTPTPTTTTEKTRPPSPNHGTSGVSERNIGEDDNMGASKDKEEGTSMEVAEGGGSEGGGSEEEDAVVGTSGVAEVVEEVQEAITPESATETVEPKESAKVNLDYACCDHV